MIKQIQLRGISRTPSDRATSDGGCAESLNVHLDQQETAPAQMPTNISETVYGSYERHPIVFIHKMTGITNYISHEVKTVSGVVTTMVHAYGTVTDPQTGTEGFQELFKSTGSDLPLRHAASVGNILIVFLENGPWYFLYKDGAYQKLGNSIPKPAIDVATYPRDYDGADATIEGDLATTDNPSDWASAAERNSENNDSLLSTIQNFWDAVSLKVSESRSAGKFLAPFFIRYAVRLYDGTYIHTSCPILCGGGSTDNWVEGIVVPDTGADTFHINVNFNNVFDVYLRCDYSAYIASWGEIVKSIDIFASSPIYTPARNAAFESLDSMGRITFEGMGGESKAKTIRDEVLSKGQFYKVMSIPVSDNGKMGEFAAGTVKLANAETVSGDLLFEQEDMPDGYRDGAQYLPVAETRNFNNRLMLAGVTELLSRGDATLNGQVGDGNWGSAAAAAAYTYYLRYHIVDSATGTTHYVLANYNSSSAIKSSYFLSGSGGISLHNATDIESGDKMGCYPTAWLCYPDTRCVGVDVYYSYSSYSVTKKAFIPMEQHPLLECSFAFLGFGVKLGTVITDNYSGDEHTSEDRAIDEGNKLLLSEFSNPFLFPAGNIMTFSDKLVGTALTSVPLSEGQFGEFPLYVFTEGGIRMLLTTHEGTFAAKMTPPNLSRHVALPGTILSLEQAIVFITEKGVMMLTGSSVTDISQNMNGRPIPFDYGFPDTGQISPPSEMRKLFLGSAWKNLLYALGENAPFMAFMQAAKVAYDSKGSRFIFFNPAKGYQYVYKLDTQTWHKIATNFYSPTILNAYPGCIVSRVANGSGEIWDFSTELEDTELLSRTDSVKGVVITRPFDLGEPDIRKTIRSIRIRGDYNRDDVQYILLGSFDSIHWKRLVSLRGGSYKTFRLIILTDLAPTERITWIDVDYETRMTNRLR